MKRLRDLYAVQTKLAAARAQVQALEAEAAETLGEIAAELAGAPTGGELLTLKQAAAQWHVSVDWLRDHGDRLGLLVRLSDGVVRVDPAALEAIRRRRLPAA